jgi:hypothetical protein
MYELDHMLNGQGSHQHHQDILRWTQDERFAAEVEAAQRHPLTAQRSLRRLRATLLSITTALFTILGRSVSHAAVNEAQPSSGRGFAQESNH